jgi:hypothetical protein
MTMLVRCHQVLQGILHQALALGVEGAGGLVQQQQRRVAQDGAGHGDALALAAGQAHAALAEEGVVALRQPLEKASAWAASRRGAHLLVVGALGAVADVLPGEAPKMTGSCGTTAMFRTQLGRIERRRSTPSNFRRPAAGRRSAAAGGTGSTCRRRTDRPAPPARPA